MKMTTGVYIVINNVKQNRRNNEHFVDLILMYIRGSVYSTSRVPPVNCQQQDTRDVNKTSTFKTKTKTKTPDLKTWTKTAHGTK